MTEPAPPGDGAPAGGPAGAPDATGATGATGTTGTTGTIGTIGTIGQSGIGDRWRSVPRRWRVVVVLVVALAGFDVLAAVTGSFGATGSGSAAGPSSSFDPSPQGTQALAELLVRFGHPVRRLEEPFSAGAVPPSTTLVVADPQGWDAAQSGAVAAFVRSGGRAVLAGGPLGASDLRTILGIRAVPVYSPVGVHSAHAVGAAPEVAGVSMVDADPSGGAWDITGGTTPILRNGDAVLAVVANVGAGRVVLLASASPLRNQFLGDADNAAFALDLAGGAGRAVAFDEYAHGFGSGGLGALPTRWKWALGLAGVAALVWIWSAARRFGPPGATERVLAPARVGYVDGLATVLSATADRGVGAAVEPVARATRSSLCRYLGVPDEATDQVLASTARAAGVPDGIVGAALAPPTDRQSALATGRAHAWLERERRSYR